MRLCGAHKLQIHELINEIYTMWFNNNMEYSNGANSCNLIRFMAMDILFLWAPTHNTYRIHTYFDGMHAKFDYPSLKMHAANVKWFRMAAKWYMVGIRQ